MQDGCSLCSVPSLNLAPLPSSSLYWTLRKRIPPSSPISTGEIQLLLFLASQTAVSPHDIEFRQVLTTSLFTAFRNWTRKKVCLHGLTEPPRRWLCLTLHLSLDFQSLLSLPHPLQPTDLVIHWVIRINAN